MGYIYIVCMHVCMYVAYAIIFGKLLELANGPIMDSPSRSVPGVRSSNELDEVFLCDVAGSICAETVAYILAEYGWKRNLV